MTDEIDLKFLKRALILSRESLEKGGFPVAALLVRDRREISYGLSCTESSHDVTAHGEVQAIRAAGSQAIAPLTLYSSLEPCLMCLAASAWAGVNRIVFGCRRNAVDSSYYVNNTTVEASATLLTSPPELVMIPNFESEVVALIKEYEERITIKSSGPENVSLT
jgi:tRNA(Arg) A34 adenosine deaminase TadA